jgi:hypothetical protein
MILHDIHGDSLGFDVLLHKQPFGVGTIFFVISHRSCSFKSKVTLAFQERKLDAPSNLSSNLRQAITISRSAKELPCAYFVQHQKLNSFSYANCYATAQQATQHFCSEIFFCPDLLPAAQTFCCCPDMLPDEISLIRMIKIFATVLLLQRADLILWGFLDAF